MIRIQNLTVQSALQTFYELPSAPEIQDDFLYFCEAKRSPFLRVSMSPLEAPPDKPHGFRSIVKERLSPVSTTEQKPEQPSNLKDVMKTSLVPLLLRSLHSQFL